MRLGNLRLSSSALSEIDTDIIIYINIDEHFTRYLAPDYAKHVLWERDKS